MKNVDITAQSIAELTYKENSIYMAKYKLIVLPNKMKLNYFKIAYDSPCVSYIFLTYLCISFLFLFSLFFPFRMSIGYIEKFIPQMNK